MDLKRLAVSRSRGQAASSTAGAPRRQRRVAGKRGRARDLALAAARLGLSPWQLALLGARVTVSCLLLPWRLALSGAYVIGWLAPRGLARLLARNPLIVFLLLCAALWLATQAHDPRGGVVGRLDPIARALRLSAPVPNPCAGSAAAAQPDLCDDRGRRAVAANPDGQILHTPSVSVHAIWQALQAAGSPLAEEATRRDGRTYAEYIWDAGRVSGVDPAIFMGMFNVESKYGRNGVARVTHSPGNMRALNGQSSVEGYAAYPDWFAGIDATYALLRSYALHGAPTIDSAIPVWAPAYDHNDPNAYIAIIKDTMSRIAALNG